MTDHGKSAKRTTKKQPIGWHERCEAKFGARILRLLNRRAKIVAEVHAAKARRGETVYDARRTDAILRRLLRLNRGPLRGEQVRELFTFLLHHFALGHRPRKDPPPTPPLLRARAARGADLAAVRRLCARHGLSLLPRGRTAARSTPLALARGAVLRLSGDEDEEALADLCHRAKLFSLALRPWPGAGGGR